MIYRRMRLAAFALGLSALSLGAKAQRHVIHSNRIASLQVVSGTEWMDMPITELNGSPIHVSFDDMTHDYHRYTYKIEHCDADWQITSALFTSDYLQGGNGEQTIDDYDQSINTNELYTHYRLTIPNENCRIKLSGNYKLTVYDNNADNQPMFTACFMVVDPLVKLSLAATTNTDVSVNKQHQQLSAAVNYAGIRVTDPTRQVKTIFLQNGRWDNAVINVKPDMVSGEGLQWVHNRRLIFDAGNVYRKFEILSTNHPTMGIELLYWDGKHFHADVMPDEPRQSYVYDEAAQGAFYIRNSDNTENDFVSDYVQVHFTLVAPRQPGDVYLNGAWTYDSFLPAYQMKYDDSTQTYRAAVPLKLGYYSYQYLVLKEDGTTIPVSTEGNFYETSNKYQMLVYYRGTGDRTDQLVGYKAIVIK